jgi:cyclophilin family peptidyl-prolyl cis-trans isomerase
LETHDGDYRFGFTKRLIGIVFLRRENMRAKIETSQGSIDVELFEAETPKTVNNFAELARTGFYSNLVFHRIVRGFVIQTGDPKTKNGGGNRSLWGTGGSEKTIPLEIAASLHHSQGTLGVARSQEPNSGSSQFFINLGNNSGLDGHYTVFGKVTSGMDAVNKIAGISIDQRDAPKNPSEAMLNSITLS